MHEKFKIEIQENLIAAKKQNKEKLKNTDTTFSYHCAIDCWGFFLTLSSQTILFFRKLHYVQCLLRRKGLNWPPRAEKGRKKGISNTSKEHQHLGMNQQLSNSTLTDNKRERLLKKVGWIFGN